jgi:hypothetical protein
LYIYKLDKWLSYSKESKIPEALLCPVERHSRTLQIGPEFQSDLRPSIREHIPIYKAVTTQENGQGFGPITLATQSVAAATSLGHLFQPSSVLEAL